MNMVNNLSSNFNRQSQQQPPPQPQPQYQQPQQFSGGAPPEQPQRHRMRGPNIDMADIPDIS